MSRKTTTLPGQAGDSAGNVREGDASALQALGLDVDRQEVIVPVAVIDPVAGQKQDGYVFAGGLAFEPFERVEHLALGGCGGCSISDQLHLDIAVQPSLLALQGGRRRRWHPWRRSPGSGGCPDSG